MIYLVINMSELDLSQIEIETEIHQQGRMYYVRVPSALVKSKALRTKKKYILSIRKGDTHDGKRSQSTPSIA